MQRRTEMVQWRLASRRQDVLATLLQYSRKSSVIGARVRACVRVGYGKSNIKISLDLT